MLTGTNLKYTKEFNVRIVLETIRLYGPVSRVGIARRTELTTQTVSNITRELIAASMIVEAERFQEGRGAPAVLLKLNPDGAFAVGLDLDKDHLTGVLVDLGGSVRQRISYGLNFPSPNEALDHLQAAARELIQREQISRERIRGVGVGLPGPLGVSEGSFVTNVANPTAFPGWNNVPVVETLGRSLALPIFLENNATAAAVGEWWYGAGQHVSSFFYVFFGAGLGGGLIINGLPFEGHTGNAGELGYFPSAGDPEGTYGSERPHLGVHFNLPRLYRSLQRAGLEASCPSDLARLFTAGDTHLLEWLEEGAVNLAAPILAIEYLLDPEAIFFGGSLPDTVLRALIERLEQLLPQLRIDEKMNVTPLRIATAGYDAAALGVATLPLYASFAPAPRVLMKKGEAGKPDPNASLHTTIY